MNILIQDALFDVLKAGVDAAGSASALYKADVHETVFSKVTTDTGLRIGSMEARTAPAPGDAQMSLFDVAVLVVSFVRISGSDKTERRTARNLAWQLAVEAAALIHDDETLGEQVETARCVTIRDGYDSIDGNPYAIAHIVVAINETGDVDFRQWKGE